MTTITLRIDSELETLLADLMADGSDRSTVIRDAVRAAWRTRHQQSVVHESEAIAADPDDLAEVRSIQRDLEELRAW